MGTWGRRGAGSCCLQQQWGGMGTGMGMLRQSELQAGAADVTVDPEPAGELHVLQKYKLGKASYLSK